MKTLSPQEENLFFDFKWKIIGVFLSSLLVQIKFPISAFHYGVYNLLMPLFSFCLLIEDFNKIKKFYKDFKFIIIMLFIFYFWCWISALFSPYKHVAFKYTIKYFIYLILFLAFSVSSYKISKKDFYVQYKIILYFLLFLAIMGIIEYFYHTAKIFSLFRSKDSLSIYPRIASLMQWPNQFGVLLSIGTILSVILEKKKIITRERCIFFVVLFIINIALSGSKDSWLVFMLGIALIYIYKIANMKKVSLLILWWIICILFFPVSTHRIGIKNSKVFPLIKWTTMNKITQKKITKNRVTMNKVIKNKVTMNIRLKSKIFNSLKSRVILWKKAIVEIKKHPLSGIGLEAFEKINGKGYNTHNLFLNILVDLGLIGFFLFIWLSFLFIKQIDLKNPLYTVPIILVFMGQIVDCFIYDFTFMSVSLYLLAISITAREYD